MKGSLEDVSGSLRGAAQSRQGRGSWAFLSEVRDTVSCGEPWRDSLQMLEIWSNLRQRQRRRLLQGPTGLPRPANDLVEASRTHVLVSAFICSPDQASGQLLDAGCGETMGFLTELWIQLH